MLRCGLFEKQGIQAAWVLDCGHWRVDNDCLDSAMGISSRARKLKGFGAPAGSGMARSAKESEEDGPVEASFPTDLCDCISMDG